MTIALLLTASLLTTLAAPGGESPDAELDIFAMQPEAQMAYLFGPIENVPTPWSPATGTLGMTSIGKTTKLQIGTHRRIQTWRRSMHSHAECRLAGWILHR